MKTTRTSLLLTLAVWLTVLTISLSLVLLCGLALLTGQSFTFKATSVSIVLVSWLLLQLYSWLLLTKNEKSIDE